MDSLREKNIFFFKLIVLNLKPLKLKTSSISPLFYLTINKHMHQDLGVRVLVAGQYLV